MLRHRRGSSRLGSTGGRSASTESVTSLVTDTGTRLEFTGKLALCVENGIEYFGVECSKCDNVCIDVKVWTRCSNCGELVVKILPDFRPHTGLRVDWATGITSVVASRSIGTRSLPSDFVPSSPSSEGSYALPDGREAACRVSKYSVFRGWRTGERSTATVKEESDTEDSEGPREHPSSILEPVSVHGEPVDIDMVTVKTETDQEGESNSQAAVDTSVVSPNDIELSDNGKNETEEEPDEVEDRAQRLIVKQIAENAGFAPDYIARRLEGMAIAKTPAQYKAYHAAHTELIKRAPDPFVLPGRGDIMTLGRLSRFQRIVNDKVALEFGLEYPYCDEETMDEVEHQRTHWCCEAVWDYLKVPRPYRNSDNKDFYEAFKACFKEWKLGRSIYKDRIEIARKDGSIKTRSVPQWIPDRGMIHLPNPLYYR